MEIIYREAVPADAEKLLNYLKTVGGESDNLSFGPAGISFSVEQEEKLLENQKKSERSMILLAFDGEEIVGNATIEGNRHPRFGHRRNLAISVRKDHWNQGIGSGLMRRLIRFSRDTGAEVIHLEVRSDNQRAIALYRKFGFEKVGTYEKFFKIADEYFGADYMNLYL